MNGELRRGRMNDMNKFENMRKAPVYTIPEPCRKENTAEEMPLVHESCSCSGFTMMAVGASVLSFIGIIVYALIV